MQVALIYNTSKAAAETAAGIATANNIRAAAYQANVVNQTEIENAVQRIVSDFGKLDVMVVNSGVTSNIPAEDYTPEQWREVMNVNLDGAFYTAQAAARVFKKQGRGNVIFTSSVSATLVNVPQKQAAYNASKAAVVHLAKSLAVEWIEHTRVNCISPGFIATDILDIHPPEWREKWNSMVPAKRFAEAYELKGVGACLPGLVRLSLTSQAYVFAASDASSYMTGADIIIDGGYTLP